MCYRCPQPPVCASLLLRIQDDEKTASGGGDDGEGRPKQGPGGSSLGGVYRDRRRLRVW